MISELKFPCAFERVSLAGVIFRNLTIHNRFKELMILEMKYSSAKSNNSEINCAKCIVRFIQSLPQHYLNVSIGSPLSGLVFISSMKSCSNISIITLATNDTFFYQQPASKDAENSFVYQAESLTDIVIH